MARRTPPIPGRRLFRFPRRSAAQVAADVETELDFHLDMVAEELIREGWPPEAARQEAARRFGDLNGTREYCRALDERKEKRMRWMEALEELGQDVRYAGRQLWKSPAFTLVAVLTLALGTGVTTAIFSVVDTVLLRPLPFAEPERLVRVSPTTREGDRDSFSVLNFLDWRQQSATIAGATGAAAYDSVPLNLSGDGEPERLQGVAVSASFFSVLGVKPLHGHFFTEGDERAGAPRVVVVSEELWRRRFGADPGLVGRAITLNGEPATVLGITARGARYPFTSDLWVPFVLDEDALKPNNRGALFLNAIARLAPGVSLAKARAEAAAIARRLELQYPEANTGVGMMVEPMQSQVVEDVRLPLLVLMGAVVCVLLIACVNVANLLLVRAAARESEIAIRSALGAGRSRIVRQLLTESVALALLGGAAGVLLAFWLTRLLVRLAPEGTPRLDEVGIDAPVLLFGLGVTILTGLLFGLVPALQASRPDLNRTLKEGARGAKGGGSRVRHFLVVVETALAVILLAGAGLLIQSFARLQRVDPGFDTENVVMFRFTLPDAKYPERPQVERFIHGVLERGERLPGVRTAGAAFIMPLSGSDFSLSFTVDGRPPVPAGQEPSIKVQVATPGFFQALRIPLVSGRMFGSRDRKGAPRVVLLNQAAARRYFPGENPLGQRIELGWVRDDERQGGEVVGIIGDIKQVGLDQPAEPELYMPFAQAPVAFISIVLRASGDPAALAALAAAVRAQMRQADPDLPIYNLGPLSDAIAKASSQPRFYMLLLGAFAAVALLLAAVGIYGVISYAVGQRSQEIGIRMALGATQNRVLRTVVGQGLVLALIGAAAGVAGAVVATRGLRSLLYEVSATDPPTYLGVTIVLVLVAACASYFPARRAAETEPSLAIRGE